MYDRVVEDVATFVSTNIKKNTTFEDRLQSKKIFTGIVVEKRDLFDQQSAAAIVKFLRHLCVDSGD